jgi:hypothetical protein
MASTGLATAEHGEHHMSNNQYILATIFSVVIGTVCIHYLHKNTWTNAVCSIHPNIILLHRLGLQPPNLLNNMAPTKQSIQSPHLSSLVLKPISRARCP